MTTGARADALAALAGYNTALDAVEEAWRKASATSDYGDMQSAEELSRGLAEHAGGLADALIVLLAATGGES